MQTLSGTPAEPPELFHQTANRGHSGRQSPVGTNLHAAITANAPTVIKRNRPPGFNHGGCRAIGPALPAAKAALWIDDRLLEDMGPDKTL